MKRIVLLLFLGLSMLHAQADDVSQEQALSLAVQFVSGDASVQGAKAMTGNGGSAPQLTLAYVGRPATTAASAKSMRSGQGVAEAPASFYVFNRGSGQGWIIVSGSEATTDPILAFADRGDFNYDAASENMQWILSRYTDAIDKARARGIRPQWSAAKAAPQRPTIIVEPLLPCNYNQSSPYNDQCPVVDGTRCPTGCVATAVAQIMRYWQWPKQGLGSHTNTWKTGEHRDFNHAYTWDDSPEALATLMADVGTACDMQYTPTESGAYSSVAMEALVHYFGYSSEVRWGGGSDNMLRKELDAKRPVYYEGHKYVDWEHVDPFNPPPTSSRDNHAFVCDGYNDQGFFHFNLGWGGLDNGWYRTNVIKLSSDDYSMWMGSMLCLQPSYNTRFEKDGCLYEITDDRHARLIRLYDQQEVLTISAQVEWEGKVYETPTSIEQEQSGKLDKVKKLVIGEGITTIGSYAFSQSGIEQVTFPSTLTRIDEFAFRDCNALKAVTIGSQTVVAPNAFNGCKALKDIVIEDGVQAISDAAFVSCGVEHLRLPKGIKIGNRTFYACNKLTTVDNLAYVKEVGDEAFLGCTLNTGDELKFESVERIGNSAFERGQVARKVILPATTRFVGTHAFKNITGGKSTFEGYVVSEDNPAYAHNDEGMLLSKDKTVLINCPEGEVVPEGVERIASQAFDKQVRKITLPNTLKEIDGYVFHHYDIHDIYIHASTPPRMDPMALAGDDPYPHAKLYVPDGALEAYKYAPIWSTFDKIIDELDTCYAVPLPADSALACYVHKRYGEEEYRYDFAVRNFGLRMSEFNQWDESINNFKTVSGYTITGNAINGNQFDVLQFTNDESARISYVVPSTIKDEVWSVNIQKVGEDYPGSISHPTGHKGEMLLENGTLTVKDASGSAVASYKLAELQHVSFYHEWSPALRQFTMKWEDHYDFGFGPRVQQREEKCPYYLDGDWTIDTNDDGTQSFHWGNSGFDYVPLGHMHNISMPQNKMDHPVREKFRFFNIVDRDGNEESMPLASFDEVVFEDTLIHLADMGQTVRTLQARELKRMYLSKKSAAGLTENRAQLAADEPQHLYIHIGKTWKEVGLSRAGNIFTDGASLFVDSIAYPLNAIDSITFERPAGAVQPMQGSVATHAVTPLCPEVKTADYAIRFSASALTDESRVKVTPVYPSALAAMEGVRSARAYDITLDRDGTGSDTHQLHGVVEIRIPFTKHAGYDVVASYFDETDSVRDWRPICHRYDSVRQEMVILSNHLTRFGIFDIDHEHSRDAKITYTRFYDIPLLETSGEETARNLLELAKCVTEQPEDSKSFLDKVAGLYSTGSTFALDMGYNAVQSCRYYSKLLDDYDDHIALLGATVSAYQVYSAALQGKMNEVASGTLSLALNQMTTYTGKFLGGPIWAASMFSVAVLNYSLTQFGESAWEGRTDKYRAAYHTYYTKGEPGYRSQADWVSALWPVVNNRRLTKERLDAAIDHLVRRHCDRFWEIGADEQAHYIANAGLWWTGWGGLNESMKQTISKEYRSEVYRTDIAQAMKTISDSLHWKAYDEGRLAAENYRKLMNKVITIMFKDSKLKNDSSVYAGCTVRFADLPSTIEDPKLWETKLDKQGKGYIQFRIFAQVYNNIEPRLVVVNEKGDIVKRLDLELDYKNTVDLSQDNTLGFDPKHPEDMNLNVVMTPDSLYYDQFVLRGGVWDNNHNGEPYFYEYESTSDANKLRHRVFFRNFYGDIAELMTEHSSLLAQPPSADTHIEVNGLSLHGTYDAKTKTGSGQFTMNCDYEATVATTDDWMLYTGDITSSKLWDKVIVGGEVIDGVRWAVINALLGGRMAHQLSGTYEVKETPSGKMVYTFKGAGTYHLDAKLIGGFNNIDFHMFGKVEKQADAEPIVNEASYDGQCTIDQSFVFGE